MKSILISSFLPSLLALIYQPVLYSPTCPVCSSLTFYTYSYSNSLAPLPTSQLQLWSKSSPSYISSHITLYHHKSVCSPRYTQQMHLQTVKHENTLPARTLQICIKEQKNMQIIHYSFPELLEISNAFALAVVQNDVNYIGGEIEKIKGLKAIGYRKNYIELDKTDQQEMCENTNKVNYCPKVVRKDHGVCEVEIEYMNILVSVILIVGTAIWVMIDKNKCLDEKDSLSCIEKLDESVQELLDSQSCIEKLDDSTQELLDSQSCIEKLDDSTQELLDHSRNDCSVDSLKDVSSDVDRILLNVDTLIYTSQSFKDQILSAHSQIHSKLPKIACLPIFPSDSYFLNRSYSSPIFSENQPNALIPFLQPESPEVSLELNLPSCNANSVDVEKVQSGPTSEKEDTSEPNESFGSYEDLAGSDEEEVDSSLDFNSKLSREYDIARNLCKRSKQPGIIVSDV